MIEKRKIWKVSLARTIKITLITISIVLFSVSTSSFIINVYAQTQGGAATSGPATGGAATSGGGNSTSHLISNSSSITNKSPFR